MTTTRILLVGPIELKICTKPKITKHYKTKHAFAFFSTIFSERELTLKRDPDVCDMKIFMYNVGCDV
jgi:hypothetical protein